MSESLPVFPVPTTYESRPVTIQAVQWDGTAQHSTGILDWIQQSGANASYSCTPITKPCTGTDEGHHLIIRTIEGNMAAEAGYWIIKGTEGEFYPCKDSVFQRKYRESTKHRAPEINITTPVINIQGGSPTPGDVAAQLLQRTMKGLTNRG